LIASQDPEKMVTKEFMLEKIRQKIDIQELIKIKYFVQDRDKEIIRKMDTLEARIYRIENLGKLTTCIAI
jgi:RNA-binding protein YhbY